MSIQLLEDLERLLKPKEKEQKDWVKRDEVRRILKTSPKVLKDLRISRFINHMKIGGSKLSDKES
ncbi:hypothetical protein MM239_14270 [Belliella sp. DSM 111904]|uniref:50S ribosomal protein L29 n=1 Tax=Belliella filtrata TaxID=2923435 RepID=A0ABS9V2I5_9BACT|nr:hypothetical protein [Belliella filtrata]MCH7410569.1 hypothetical protein [Belliella filtrata]